MKLINDKPQIESNIRTIENYITDGTDVQKVEVLELIRRGKCLVAYKVGNETRFVPSRFIGYINNSLKKHNKNETKNGTETNPVISTALESKLLPSESLEKKYIQYCKNLGVEASNYSKRKYWYFELEEDFIENKEMEGEFPEGKVIERIHKSRERNSQVVEIAKRNFKLKNRRLFCEICGFDFKKIYGTLGENFIEAHHTIFVSDMKPNHLTTPDEIALLCSNCHRMVHKKRPWLTMNKLRTLLKRK